MEAVIIRIGLALVANAIALLVAALLLDRFEIEVTTFVWVVLLFTAISLAVDLSSGRSRGRIPRSRPGRSRYLRRSWPY